MPLDSASAKELLAVVVGSDSAGSTLAFDSTMNETLARSELDPLATMAKDADGQNATFDMPTLDAPAGVRREPASGGFVPGQVIAGRFVLQGVLG